MRLLDRYLLRELLVPLAYCLGGFLLFWVFTDLLSELSDFQKNRMRFGDVAEYYLVKAPDLLVTIMPIALLLAMLYALTNHARHHELTAMRAAGVGLTRLCVPYFAVGTLFSVGLFVMNEFWVPDANESAEMIRTRWNPQAASTLGPQWQRNLAFRNERERRIWNIGAFNRETGEMLLPNFDWQLADGSRRRLAAARAVYTNGNWVFTDVRELVYAAAAGGFPEPSQTNELTLAELSETPEQIRSEIKFTALAGMQVAAKRPRMSLDEIHNYERLHPYLPARDRARLDTQFQGRLAQPWTCLVVVLIAIPFGAPSGRRNVFVGVAASIFIGFGYVVLQQFAMALGTAGYLPPWLAAWLPNALFAVASIALIRRVR